MTPYGFTQGAAVDVAMPTKRSAIPKVIGILMLIFGGLAVLSGLIGLVSGPGDEFNQFGRLGDGDIATAFGRYKTLNMVSNLTSLIIGAIELYAGGRALMYRSNAPGWVLAYAWLNIGMTIIVLAMTYAWMMPMLEKHLPGAAGMMGVAVILGGIISIAWPIVAMALMTRPSAKAVCSNDF